MNNPLMKNMLMPNINLQATNNFMKNDINYMGMNQQNNNNKNGSYLYI